MELSSPRALLAFYTGTRLDPLLERFGNRGEISVTHFEIGQDSGELTDGEFDVFLMVVDASAGISKSMIEIWNHFLERQVPRMMLVQGLELNGTDFDDIVLIGDRVLEKFATPFLVLHDEDGAPVGLIRLIDETVIDYSKSSPVLSAADGELRELVKDFKTEFDEEFVALGEDAFAAGIFAIALPIDGKCGFGEPELKSFLATLSKL